MLNDALKDKTIAVIGGTGAEGAGLALRWAHAGLPVIIGSRDAQRAADVAAELNSRHRGPPIRGMANADAAAAGDVVVLSVPYASQQQTAASIAPALTGKVLIDVTVPLMPPKVDRVQLPGGRSAVEALQELLGPEVTVVSAFQNVSAKHLSDLGHTPACDVLVTSDKRAARDLAIALAEAAGLCGIDAGVLANSAAVEAMTSVLIAINKRYKLNNSGIRITGLPAREASGASSA
ncbi:MAG: NADPH-dependent F420 reductase [Hyphomicrobiaceae bacterium]